MDDVEAPSFANLLSDAIRQRGLTLDRITHRLGEMGFSVSTATLSYWQNGRSQPTRAHSQPIITALETILGVEAGSLSAAAPAQQVRRRLTSGQAGQPPLPETVEELLARAGLSTSHLRKTSTHVTLTLDEHRSERYEVVRSVVQCLADGTDRFPVVASVGFEGGDPQQRVEGVSNCTVERVVEVPERELVLTEMRLPRPLARGELLMLEYMTTWPTSTEPTESLEIATGRLNELVLEVQFDPAALPSRVVTFTRQLGQAGGIGAPGAQNVPLTGNLGQAVRVDVGVGIHCLRWQW